MRQNTPPKDVLNLDGEELEELLEDESSVLDEGMSAPFDETQQLTLEAPDQALSTGPGAYQQTEVSSGYTPPRRNDLTANLRKGGTRAFTHQEGSQPDSSSSREDLFGEFIDPLLGETMGSYRILSLIGEGGMGRVYLAEHIKLGRRVALKLLRPEYAVKKDAVQRFFNEAKSVNRIGHDNIVDITDFVELDANQTFIIMELLEGDDLSDIQRSRDQPMPLHRAMQITLQICDALIAAHKTDIVHRDLKPDNIFIVNTPTKHDFVKLLDFGVAKLLGESQDNDSFQTAAGSVIGTPAYMSPEQATGIPVDHRSDIYSLGAILYELFTGHPVFRAKSFGEYVVKHMNNEPIAPRNLANAPRIPAALEAVILRCLEKDPDRRFPSVEELRTHLMKATSTVETVIKGKRLTVPRRHGLRLWLLIPVVLGVAVLAIGAFWLASGLTIDDVRHTKPQPRQVPQKELSFAEKGGMAKTEPLDPTPEVAHITLETAPPGASVFRKNAPQKLLGKTPFVYKSPNTDTNATFIFKLDGYIDGEGSVKLLDNTTLSISLEKKTEQDTTATPDPPPVKVKSTPRHPRKAPPKKINPGDVVDPFKS